MAVVQQQQMTGELMWFKIQLQVTERVRNDNRKQMYENEVHCTTPIFIGRAYLQVWKKVIAKRQDLKTTVNLGRYV